MLADHYHLTPDDECMFLGDYNAGDGYRNNTPQAINQTISNLKKLPNDRHAVHRNRSVDWCGDVLERLERQFPGRLTWVPIPGSKLPTHPEYNPRILDILSSMNRVQTADIRQILYNSKSTRASHQSAGNRLSLDEVRDVMCLNEGQTQPTPEHILVVDDVITAGTHFRVASDLLSARFPSAAITGLFIGRTIHRRPDPFADLDDLEF